MLRRRLLGVVAAGLFALGVAACGGGEGATAEVEPQPPTTGEPGGAATAMASPEAEGQTESATVEPSPTALPAPTPTAESSPTTTVESEAVAPVLGRLEWFVGFLNDPDPEVDDVAEQFDGIFLAEVSAEEVVETTPAIVGDAEPPWGLADLEQSGFTAVAIVESSDGARYDVSISVTADPPHRIDGLFISPVADVEPPDDFADLIARLDEIASETAVGIYDVSDGRCEAIHAHEPDRPLAIGSVFKLWVLAELAAQVERGTVAWDDTVTVQTALKSSPDGQVFTQPAGTEVTLRKLAEVMIRISDNSATDHLISRLGRVNIEAAMVRSEVADPAANIPLLSTGDLFWLKFFPEAPNADEYLALDPAGRRELLDELVDRVLPWVVDPESIPSENADGVPLTDPRDLDLEWFASPDDLCRTLLHLDDLARRPGLEPVTEMLEADPDASNIDRARFPVVRFKGGSEPGVLAGAWWLQRDDGRRFVIVGSLNDSSRTFDELVVVETLGGATSLID